MCMSIAMHSEPSSRWTDNFWQAPAAAPGPAAARLVRAAAQAALVTVDALEARERAEDSGLSDEE